MASSGSAMQSPGTSTGVRPGPFGGVAHSVVSRIGVARCWRRRCCSVPPLRPHRCCGGHARLGLAGCCTRRRNRRHTGRRPPPPQRHGHLNGWRPRDSGRVRRCARPVLVAAWRTSANSAAMLNFELVATILLAAAVPSTSRPPPRRPFGEHSGRDPHLAARCAFDTGGPSSSMVLGTRQRSHLKIDQLSPEQSR